MLIPFLIALICFLHSFSLTSIVFSIYYFKFEKLTFIFLPPGMSSTSSAFDKIVVNTNSYPYSNASSVIFFSASLKSSRIDTVIVSISFKSRNVISSYVSCFQKNAGKFKLIKIPDRTLIPIKAPKNSSILSCVGELAPGFKVHLSLFSP